MPDFQEYNLQKYFPFQADTTLVFRIPGVYPLFQPVRMIHFRMDEKNGQHYFYFFDQANHVFNWGEDKAPPFQWPQGKSRISFLPGVMAFSENGLLFSFGNGFSEWKSADYAANNFDKAQLILSKNPIVGEMHKLQHSSGEFTFSVGDFETISIGEKKYENCLQLKIAYRQGEKIDNIIHYYAPEVGPVLVIMPSGIRYELDTSFPCPDKHKPSVEAIEHCQKRIAEEEEIGNVVFEKYAEKEKTLPSPPSRFKNFWILLPLRLPVFLLVMIATIVLQFLRLWFGIIRKIQLFKMKKQFERINRDDPDDEWRDAPMFEKPQRKPTQVEIEDQVEEKKRKDKIIELGQKAWKNPNDIDSRADHATILAVSGNQRNQKYALYEMDLLLNCFLKNGQLKPEYKTAFTYGKLCRNLSILCGYLYLPRHAKLFNTLAIEHGGISKKEVRQAKISHLFGLGLLHIVTASWRALVSDVINVWPSGKHIS